MKRRTEEFNKERNKKEGKIVGLGLLLIKFDKKN
jgi:hypothetical protein